MQSHLFSQFCSYCRSLSPFPAFASATTCGTGSNVTYHRHRRRRSAADFIYDDRSQAQFDRAHQLESSDNTIEVIGGGGGGWRLRNRWYWRRRRWWV